MKRALWVFLLAAPVVAAAVVLVLSREDAQFTTSSREAAAALVAGRQAEMKLYSVEARERFEEALALDPDFVVAKLLLASYLPKGGDEERAGKLLAEVRQADLGKLTATERFMVSYSLARRDHKQDEATRVLEEYLAEHPRDSYALFARCSELWARPDWEAAERCNQELLAVDPNWVLSYNYLGYIAMAQGRFTDAEKNFRSYLYLAPDQANPHDSLGELLTVLGRYDEAERELEEALRLRPDFCASYGHLFSVAVLRGDLDKAAAMVARAKAGPQCPVGEAGWQVCGVPLWTAVLAGDWEGVWRVGQGGCLREGGEIPTLYHRAAVLTGRLTEALLIEEVVAKYLKKPGSATEMWGEVQRAALEHLEGVRLLAQGHADEAVAKLAAADRALVFTGDGQGTFKLFNQLALAGALAAAGKPQEAAEMLEEVRTVNPDLAKRFGPGSVMASFTAK